MFNAIKTRVTDICGKGSYVMPRNSNHYETGLPGLYLAKKLGVRHNNRDSADLSHGRLHVKFATRNSLITLSHLDPMERVIRANKKLNRLRVPGAVENMVVKYGYRNRRGKAFHCLLKGGTPTTGKQVSGFFVTVENGRINIRHIGSDRPLASWHDHVVVNALTAKLRRLIAVEGEREDDEVSFDKAVYFAEPRSSDILNMIAQGTIRVDIGAHFRRDGSFRNNGVKFRIHRRDLEKLYLTSEVVCDYTD